MALMVLGFLAFVLVTLFWVFWAALWLVAAVCVALFWLVWPVTLLILAAIGWRAQSRYWSKDRPPRGERRDGASPSFRQSGNSAFDEYREETLSRLDEERRKFSEFLERLRKAKDKEAFDRFMSQRRGRPTPGPQGLITQQ